MGFMMDDFEDEARTVSKPKPTSARPVVYRTFDDDLLIHLNKRFDGIEGYDDFTEEEYPYSLNFYDFEIFMGDWVVTIINPVQKTKRIIANDSTALRRYYTMHSNEVWVGYNSRVYDTFMLKAIIIGLNPKIVSDDIIVNGRSGYMIDERFRDIKLYNFDIMKRMQSLKQLEAFMGNDIRETTVPFDIERPLTREEMLETVRYNVHDVEQTIEVFRRSKSDYFAHMDLIETFKLPMSMISLTQAQLTANILGCRNVDRPDDEFDLQFVDTLRIEKYRHVLDWFSNPMNHNYKEDTRLKTNVCGIPHIFAWGGLHGCVDHPIVRTGRIFHVDVTSYYPSIMIEYDLLTRNCKNKRKFKEIYDKRVELKKQGKKKEQAPYKIILNGTYGICKDRHSKAYDPRQANNVCVNGQLMLLDLLEHLEGHAEILQSNTDGIILQVADSDEAVQTMKDICKEWMDRTHMGLGFDEIDKIIQADVNNYCMRFDCQADVDGLKAVLEQSHLTVKRNGFDIMVADGLTDDDGKTIDDWSKKHKLAVVYTDKGVKVVPKLERKGAYLKELNDLDNDLPIINKALLDYMLNDVPVEDTIDNCNELIMFQKVVRISSNYKVGWHNNAYLNDKTYRVFASTDRNDTYVGKARYEGAKIERFADISEHCFIDNTEVKGKGVPENLDREWYIALARKRLSNKFGMDMSTDSLF